MKSTWKAVMKRLGFGADQSEPYQLLNVDFNKQIFVMTETKIPLNRLMAMPPLPEHLQWHVMEIHEDEGLMTVSHVREL